MLSALQHIEDDLIAAAQRRIQQRVPRRRWDVSALIAAGSLVVVTGASALAGIGPLGSTGDGNIFPRPTAPQVVVDHRGSDGTQWKAKAFTGVGSTYCVQAPPIGSGGLSQGGCESTSAVVARFQAKAPAGVVVAQIPPTADAPDRTSLVAGVVSASTTSVTVTNARTGTTRRATLTDVWTSDKQPPARAFLANLPPTDEGAPTSLTFVTVDDDGPHASSWPPQTPGGP